VPKASSGGQAGHKSFAAPNFDVANRLLGYILDSRRPAGAELAVPRMRSGCVQDNELNTRDWI
jgi:hypothetical protein